MKKLTRLIVILSGFFVLGMQAASANDEAIYASCKKDLKLSDGGCDCVLKAVHEKLNEAQTEMLTIMIKGNNAAIGQAMAEGKISDEDMLLLTNFMTKTPQMCEGQ